MYSELVFETSKINRVAIEDQDYEFSIGGDDFPSEFITSKAITYNGDVAGGVAVDWNAPTPEIAGIVVKPKYRRLGIGKAVIRELLKKAKKFYVRSTPSAKKFWESVGVKFIGKNEDSELWEGYLER